MAKKVYAIKEGFDFNKNERVENLIVNTWAECLTYVKGVKGAKYKSFESLQEAKSYLNDTKKLLEKGRDEYPKDLMHIYVDGSYSIQNCEYSYGLVAVKDDVILHVDYGKDKEKDTIRQIAGELEAAIKAVEYALERNEKKIVLFHDYEGIFHHATGSWSRNDDLSKKYYEKINELFKKGIEVIFVHVKSHENDLLNELVDEKCKEVLGIESDKTVSKWLSKNILYVANEKVKNEILKLAKDKEDKIIIKENNLVNDKNKVLKVNNQEDKIGNDKTSCKLENKKEKVYYVRETESIRERSIYAHKLVKKFNDSNVEDFKMREEIIKELFGNVGKNPTIEHNFHCDLGYNIFIGDNFYAGYNFTVLDMEKVFIGNNCIIGPNVNIYTVGYDIESKNRNKTGYAIEITIGNNVWIDGNSTILPGVSIGDNSIVVAGSVVISDVPKNVVVGGNPAKVLRDI